jgi:hypothetical protein
MEIVKILFPLIVFGVVFAVGFTYFTYLYLCRRPELMDKKEVEPSVAVKNKPVCRFCGRTSRYPFYPKPDICNTCHDFRGGLE